jgi:hypothetical protein
LDSAAFASANLANTVKAAAIRDRVRQTVRFLKGRLRNERGFFYHFIDVETGEWAVYSSVLTSVV